MFRLVLLASICSFSLGCATSGQVADPAPSEGPAVPPEQTVEPAASVTPVAEVPERPIPADSLYPLLVAEFALRRRNYDVALDNYMEQAHKLDDAAIRAHATHLAQFMRREDEALEAVQLWVQAEPDNVEANNTLATLLTRQGRPVEALPHLATIGRTGAQAPYPILLNGFQQLDSSQQSALVAEVNTLSVEFPTDIQLLITQALIHEELGQGDLALGKLDSVFAQEPYQGQAVLLETRILIDQGHKTPFKRLEAALKEDPENKRLRLQYARLLTRSDMEAAREQFEIMSAQSPRDGDLLFSLALINRETGDNLAAKAYLEQMLKLEQRTDEGHFYLGRIAEDAKDPKTAVSHYMRVTGGGDFLSANHRIGYMLIGSGQGAQFHQYISNLRDKHPDKRAQLYGLEVDLLSKFSELDAGMRVVNKALREFPDSTALRYTRSMLGEQSDDLKLMESDLRIIIAREPDNATALNALGYSLANRTDRYDEAHDLIARALALEPEEAAILDSMGWILYRLGSYEEALTYLSKAYVKFPDPEVAAHLGEVLWVTGDIEAAKDVWRGALLKNPEHKILTETLQRLGVADLGIPTP